MISRTPLVSAICTTFNRGELIRPTVQSVLHQTVGDLELIIVSDGSDDDTHDHIREMAAADGRIRLEINEHTGIPATGMNLGCSLARGSHIAYVDHDDLWTPEHLQFLLERIESGADLAASGSVWVSPRGKVISRRPSASLFWHPEIQVISPVFENSQALHRAELLDEVGPWSEGHYGLEDWDMWLRMTDAGARVATVVERTVHETISPRSLHRRLERRFGFELLRAADTRSAREALKAMAAPAAAAELAGIGTEESLQWHLRLAEDERFVFPSGFAPDRATALKAMPEALQASRKADASLNDAVQVWTEETPEGVAAIYGINCMSAHHARRFIEILRNAQPRYFAALDEVVSEFAIVPAAPEVIDRASADRSLQPRS